MDMLRAALREPLSISSTAPPAPTHPTLTLWQQEATRGGGALPHAHPASLRQCLAICESLSFPCVWDTAPISSRVRRSHGPAQRAVKVLAAQCVLSFTGMVGHGRRMWAGGGRGVSRKAQSPVKGGHPQGRAGLASGGCAGCRPVWAGASLPTTSSI